MRKLGIARWSAVASLLALLLVESAGAAVVVSRDRDVFMQIITSNPLFVETVETWDTYAPDTIIPNGSTLNGITYNSTFGTPIVLNTGVALTPPNVLFQTPGIGFQPLVDSYTFGFTQPIRAFGITISSTFATEDGAYLLTTNLGDVIPSYFDPLFPGFPLGQFAGFFSTEPFTSVRLSSTANALYGMDNLVYARVVPVPEPSTLILLAMSFIYVLGVAAKSRGVPANRLPRGVARMGAPTHHMEIAYGSQQI